MADTTLVLSFGQASESGLFFVTEIDAAMMADSDGNVPATFAPGQSVYTLAHHGPDLAIVRAYESALGSVSQVGVVTRDGSMEVHFNEVGQTVELPHIPLSISVRWYGRAGALTLDGRTLTAKAAHVTGLVSYRYRAVQYKYVPPPISLGENETYPVDIDYEVRQL